MGFLDNMFSGGVFAGEGTPLQNAMQGDNRMKLAMAMQGLGSVMQGKDGSGMLEDIMGMDMEERRRKEAQDLIGGMFGGSPMGAATQGQPMSNGDISRVAGGAINNDSALPASLVNTESGGHYSARNSVRGAGGHVGHFGRGQFGVARLNDAKNAGVIPSDMTPDQFLANPDAQAAVERWHVGDINGFIENNGLSQYEGQSINGVPVTRNGMIAVAHLGGNGGLRRYLETGGQYNPADANGTSLQDYMQTHGAAQGGQAPQAPQVDQQRLMQIMMHPGIPDAVKSYAMQQFGPQQQMSELERVQLAQAQLDLEQDRNPPPDDSAKEQQISRLMEGGLDRNQAIGVVDGRYVTSRHPITGEAQVVDKATGSIIGGQPMQQATQPPAAQSPAAQPDAGLSYGGQFQGAPDSFGVEGFAKGLANTASDALGGSIPYPEVESAQQDFAVLQETLINNIASAYDRQPPSWLLENIRELVPSAGSPLQGSGRAQSKLRALQRSFETEITTTERSLAERTLSPTERQKLDARLTSLRSARDQVGVAIGAFGGGEENTTSSGVTWRVIE